VIQSGIYSTKDGISSIIEKGEKMLIKCPDCGKDVSDAAIHCLNCGRPIAGHLEVETRENPISTAGDSIKAKDISSSNLLKGKIKNRSQEEAQRFQMQDTPQIKEISVQQDLSVTTQSSSWRKPLAILICGAIFFSYIIFCALMGWKHLGGAIPVFIILALISCIWHSLVPSSDKNESSTDENK